MIVVALANNAAAIPQDATLPASILFLLKRLRNLTADRSDTGSSLTFWDFTFCSKRAVHCMARNMLMFLVIKLDATASLCDYKMYPTGIGYTVKRSNHNNIFWMCADVNRTLPTYHVVVILISEASHFFLRYD
ncbi:conserved hypothetical protein [Trichinella spiralis]|uniref:hypothetical protein n=1 Tax=Trichinella spiralis TaxID=6334 RepID=UPI0001EFC56D|nr:conserved hypothetical protein [Trichinella spiralis]